MKDIAEVRLWGEQIGALLYNEDNGVTTFEYAPNWIANGTSVAPLHLPNRPGRFTFPGLPHETFKGLPGAFADTLPDDFGNAVIDAWLVRNGLDKADFNPLDRLLYTGTRGMGALEYHPVLPNRQSQSAGDVHIDLLVELAQRVLDHRAGLKVSLDGNGDHRDAMAEIFQVGTSAGGARPKAVIAVNKDRTRVLSGQKDAPAGFHHYLLKFDGVRERSNTSEVFGDPQGYGRMEYAYYLMAVAAGITMMPSELLIEGNRAHFMTKRFDRDGNRKRHYQSLCAMDHADYKKPGLYSYEQLFGVARQLRLPRADAVEIYRRMIFNVIARNQDDHTKNFGFALDSPSAGWRLAPAFDVAFSYKPGSYWVDTHQMTLNGKRDGFTREDLLVMAKQVGGLSEEAPDLIDQCVEVVGRWRSFAREASVNPDLADWIQQNLRLTW